MWNRSEKHIWNSSILEEICGPGEEVPHNPTTGYGLVLVTSQQCRQLSSVSVSPASWLAGGNSPHCIQHWFYLTCHFALLRCSRNVQLNFEENRENSTGWSKRKRWHLRACQPLPSGPSSVPSEQTKPSLFWSPLFVLWSQGTSL